MSVLVPYEKYKDSGVEWLGEVPEGWEVVNLKHYTSTTTGFAFDSNSYISEGIPLIRIGDIKSSGAIEFEQAKYLDDNFRITHSAYKINAGDLVMAMTGATVGKLGKYDLNIPALLNQRVCKLTPTKHLNSIFFLYLTYSDIYQKHITLTAFGGAQPNISDKEIVDITFGIPPLPEQQAIADYLDTRTRRIDSLVNEQKELIELLKEKRQALISHCVTKGLDPKAKMKDSGVEWLGEVPDGWGIARLIYLTVILQDGTHFSPESYPSGDRMYLTAKNIKESGISLQNISYIPENVHKEIYARCPVKKNDILLIKDGATAGIATVNLLGEEFSLLSSVAIIRVGRKLLNGYLARVLNMQIFKNAMADRLVGGAMTRFTVDAISRFIIPLPPLPEQQAIADYLDRETAKIDTLIKEAEETITLMQEHRGALISAVVTGKVKVPGVRP